MELLNERVVIIAGPVDEICDAIGMCLAKSGAKIAFAGSDRDKIEASVSKIEAAGGEAKAVIGDLSTADDVKKMVGEVIGVFGEIHVLINNADDPAGKGIVELTYGEWNKSLCANLDPLFLLCHEVIPIMKEKKYGRVINVGSIDYLGWPGKVNYSAAKSAIFGFTRSLALETAIDNITVNTVAKGDVAHLGLSEEDGAKLAEQLPVKRLGQPEDIANAVAFFASDNSKYVTGQTLFVCGGKSMHFSMSI